MGKIEDKKKLVSRTLYVLKKISFDNVLKNLIYTNISRLVGFNINIKSKKNIKNFSIQNKKISLEICLRAAIMLIENPYFIKKLEKKLFLLYNNEKVYEIAYSKHLIGYNLLKVIINNIYSRNISIKTIKIFIKKQSMFSFKELYE